ncbi:stage V sporulation protein AF [Geomicrobium halophilum]|uniref:Stage V sporulation protein AF n=1 Tax=Geomicrobium halophilum TaxID=549000 RepID=A0A841Q0K3_9BACL|nr:spore germination protein [Geomicrobium halophilum]MBB6448978.1 stage V sporulation protein AF [Geomicrobium halophilum]
MSKTIEHSEKTLTRSIKKNEKIFNDRLNIDASFDVGVRKLWVLGKELQLYFVNSLSDEVIATQVLRELMALEKFDTKTDSLRYSLDDQVKNHLAHIQVDQTDKVDDCIFHLLSGLIFVLIDGESEAFIVDVRQYPGREPQEPDTERVTRGSRDGYTENIIENAGLTRRRVRDEHLRNEIIQIGERSHTDIVISYVNGITDPDLVAVIKKELENIKVDSLTMADKVVEEYIVNQGWNPFPLVRYTERPDVAATHLLEGHVLVMVDTSPTVIILPTTFFHHVQHAEEFRQSTAVGTFLRWIRFIGLLAAIFIVPLWLLLVLQPDMIPEVIDYVGPSDDSNVPIFAQMLIGEFGVELIRMAAIHTSAPLGTALGFVAALLVGEIAIDVGLLTAEVILYVALGAVGIFASPSHEMGVALKMVRILFILATGLFMSYGYVIAITIVIILMAQMKPLNKPYLWPFLPFDPKGMWQILARVGVPNMRLRPRIVDPKDPVRQSKS